MSSRFDKCQQSCLAVKIFTVVLIFSCCYPATSSAGPATYRKEAKAFCNLHNPAPWNDYIKSHTLGELRHQLNIGIKKAVHSWDFLAIISELDAARFDRNPYPEAQQKISRLIGEKWECPFYQQFYAEIYEPRHQKELEYVTDDMSKTLEYSREEAEKDYTEMPWYARYADITIPLIFIVGGLFQYIIRKWIFPVSQEVIEELQDQFFLQGFRYTTASGILLMVVGVIMLVAFNAYKLF